MRRIISVWLIDWPVTVWSRTAGRALPLDGQPFALVERGPRGLVLHALNAAARAKGLSRGQRHSDARTILPSLVTAPAEPEREVAALRDLARWCERWSPTVAIDRAVEGMEGLFFDVTGVAHLFDGEAALLGAMRAAFRTMGVAARLALADTPGAAWGVARFGARSGTVPPGGAREALESLPLAALRLAPETLALARRFGLKRAGDLYAMPRAGLARRFRDAEGLALVVRLDQALGVEPEPLDSLRVPPRHRVIARFAEPLIDMAGVAAALEQLCADLAQSLEDDALGARTLTVAGFRADGGVPTLSIRIGRATRRVPVWLRLFREKGLERLDLGFGIDALGLSADLAEPVAPVQPGLHGNETAAEERLGDVIDRLSARMGEGAVRIALPRASWMPERATRWVPAQGAQLPELETFDRPRPILLLDPPEPVTAGLFALPEGAPARFIWRRVTRKVVRAEGPERLSAEWWRRDAAKARTRDYYRVEDDQGARYWLYREGLYGREDAPDRPPSWWMHGLFA